MVAGRPANNFDLLRLLAALAVLVSHGFAVVGGSDVAEPVFWLSHGQTTGGKLAVCVFFVISGYLITQSFIRRRDAVGFVAARALRLMPALAVALGVLTFVVGPAVSVLEPAAYFTDGGTWRFLLGNLLLIGSPQGLPGVFETMPARDLVDAPIWTLTYEARCYAAVLGLGLCGLLNRWVVGLLVAVGCVGLKLWVGGEPVQFYTDFAAGAALYLWRVPLRGWVASWCVALCVAALLAGGFRIVAATGGAYAVIYLATSARGLPRLAMTGDLSYGLYIWAFPVQQIVLMTLGGAWWFNVLVSLPIALGLAQVSWSLVEAPALRLKGVPVRRWFRWAGSSVPPLSRQDHAGTVGSAGPAG